MVFITVAELTHSAHSYLCNASTSHEDAEERELKIPPKTASVHQVAGCNQINSIQYNGQDTGSLITP